MFGSVCVHRNVKVSFWRGLLCVLFVYIVLLKVPFRYLRWVLFVYIEILKVAFGLTCFWCCL
jgi:hypothetical protein